MAIPSAIRTRSIATRNPMDELRAAETETGVRRLEANIVSEPAEF